MWRQLGVAQHPPCSPGSAPLPAAAGINAYVAYQVVGQFGEGELTYEQAMAAIFVEGWIFVLLSITGVRGGIVKYMPKSIAMASSGGWGWLGDWANGLAQTRLRPASWARGPAANSEAAAARPAGDSSLLLSLLSLLSLQLASACCWPSRACATWASSPSTQPRSSPWAAALPTSATTCMLLTTA